MFRILVLLSVLLLPSIVLMNCKETCYTLCRSGATKCQGSGLQVCSVHPRSGCLEYVFRPCPMGQTCFVRDGVAKCVVEDTCTQKYFRKKCVGNDVYYFDNCGQQREKFTICPTGSSYCRGGKCLNGTACGHQPCSLGEKRCTSSGFISICIRDLNRCLDWGQPIACPKGKVCNDGQCEQGTCKKICLVGQKRCDKKDSTWGVQTCRTESSGCTDWGPIYACPTGQICTKGECTKQVCPDVCTVSAECEVTACGTRQTCANGVCTSGACQDRCSVGQTRCSGERLQSCVRGTNGCLDWTLPERCVEGERCQKGRCTPSSCPSSCQTDQDCGMAVCGSRRSCIGHTCTDTSKEDMKQDGGTQPELLSEHVKDSKMQVWKYGKNVVFKRFLATQSKSSSQWSTSLTDIINHEAPGNNNSSFTDPLVRAVETLYGIHAHIQTLHTPSNGVAVNAFYLFQDQIVVLNEPSMKKDKVATWIPTIWQTSSFYASHVQGAPNRNNAPLFLLDEWVVRSNRLQVALEHDSAQLPKGAKAHQAASEALEMTVFSLFLVMAIDKHAPSYLTSQPQFLEFVAWFADLTMKRIRKASTRPNLSSNQGLSFLTELRSGHQTSGLRSFCTNVFGNQWVQDVLVK